MNFAEYMNESKPINRWSVTAIFVAGAFAGALLAVAWSFMGFV